MDISDAIYAEFKAINSSIGTMAKILLESQSPDFSQLSPKESATLEYMVDIAAMKYQEEKDRVRDAILSVLHQLRDEGFVAIKKAA